MYRAIVFLLSLACCTVVVGCGDGDDKKGSSTKAKKKPVQKFSDSDYQAAAIAKSNAQLATGVMFDCFAKRGEKCGEADVVKAQPTLKAAFALAGKPGGLTIAATADTYTISSSSKPLGDGESIALFELIHTEGADVDQRTCSPVMEQYETCLEGGRWS